MLQALPCGIPIKQLGYHLCLQCNMQWQQNSHPHQDACSQQSGYGCMLFTLTSPTECDVVSAASSETVAFTLSSVTEERNVLSWQERNCGETRVEGLPDLEQIITLSPLRTKLVARAFPIPVAVSTLICNTQLTTCLRRKRSAWSHP